MTDENRKKPFEVIKAEQVIWFLFGLLEAFLGLRFLFKLLGANPESGFSSFLYDLTGFFLIPFQNLFNNPSVGDSILELTTIVAMPVYALIAWAFGRLVDIIFVQPVETQEVSASKKESTQPVSSDQNQNTG